MKKLKFLCAALTAILTLGNYTGGYVCAASDDTQTKEAPTKETQAKEAQAEDSQSPAPEFDTLIFHKIPVNLMITGIFLSINDFLCMMYIDVSL